MDAPSFCDGFNTHHIGTLRCRQVGASTPSTEPPSEGEYADAAEELYLYNARRSEATLEEPAKIVSVEVIAKGAIAPEAFAQGLKATAAELCVAIEELVVDEDKASFVATGWVYPVTALCALIIEPGRGTQVEEVGTRPVATRVLPPMPCNLNQEVVRNALIRGSAQKVGFRVWCQKEARARGLVGFVRNRSDGTVQIVVSGPLERVDAFLQACQEGPERADIQKIDVEDGWSGTTALPRNDFLRFKSVIVQS